MGNGPRPMPPGGTPSPPPRRTMENLAARLATIPPQGFPGQQMPPPPPPNMERKVISHPFPSFARHPSMKHHEWCQTPGAKHDMVQKCNEIAYWIY
ncbi:hypothetical protein SLE2022_101320 [Rubroshorea leprosula]